VKKKLAGITIFLMTITFLVSGATLLGKLFNSVSFLSLFIFDLSLLLSLQSLFTLCWMLYFWNDPGRNANKPSQKIFAGSQIGFTALLPARHEDGVIADTIRAVSNIDYPEHLKELYVLCRGDDTSTIEVVFKIISELNKPNIQLVTFFDDPINKPHALNIGLSQSRQPVVCVFDAEDQPHPDIYRVINSEFLQKKCDVVQSGVQLMNYRSTWFSAFNVLEYFFWFKSGLPFFYRFGNITPLGGNSVFVKTELLKSIGGWDEKCLTEDADIAFRLKLAGAKFCQIYDEETSTREETPDTLISLIRQRTRWNQGFLQVFFKFDWSRIPGLTPKLMGMYILLSPFISLFTVLYFPAGVLIAVFTTSPVTISLLSFLPFYLFAGQILVTLFGMWEFGQKYHQKISWIVYLRIIIFYFPYQWVLAASSLRSIEKYIKGINLWEKTFHPNAHRQSDIAALKPDVI